MFVVTNLESETDCVCLSKNDVYNALILSMLTGGNMAHHNRP